MIVAPIGDDPRFPALVEEVVRIALGAADGGRPLTLASLIAGKAGQAVELEAAVTTPPGATRVKARFAAASRFALGVIFHKLKLRAGAFDAALYANDVAANADFRKFDDGLRLTLDCTPAFADALEARLAAADEFAEYGAFRQESAQLTCFVPSITDRGHLHLVDGAGGGYTMAAQAMKARQAARAA